MTHAMVFTGYGTDGENKPTKFRVENSWGESRGGEKGKNCLNKKINQKFLINFF